MKTIVTKLVHCPLQACSTEARSEWTLSKRRRSKITCKHCTLPGQRKLPNSLLRGVCLCLWIIECYHTPTFLIVQSVSPPCLDSRGEIKKFCRTVQLFFSFCNERIRALFFRDQTKFNFPFTLWRWTRRSPRARSPRPRGSINSAEEQ